MLSWALRGATCSAALQCVEIVVDNETSPSYTMLTLRCEDRKGLLYDIFRTLKDIDLRSVACWLRLFTSLLKLVLKHTA